MQTYCSKYIFFCFRTFCIYFFNKKKKYFSCMSACCIKDFGNFYNSISFIFLFFFLLLVSQSSKRISLLYQNDIKNSTQPFAIGLQHFFKWSWKICNLSLCRDIPFLVPEILSKIQSNPSPFGNSIFLFQMAEIFNFSTTF